MSSELLQTEVPVRENRLKSIIHYYGTAEGLLNLQPGEKSPADRSYSQCSDCAQMCASTLCFFIRDAAVVVHSPIGCYSNTPINDQRFTKFSVEHGQDPDRVKVICSNLTEKDTVYGGLKKLKDAVYEAKRRFSPSVIFVQSSCAAGIIGDDLEGTAGELEEELQIPIIPIYCEGFKSKIWSSGFDAAYHGILKRLVKPAQKKQKDLVNIFGFLSSDTFTPFLKKLGLRPNYLVPLASVDSITRMTEASCSAYICETLGTYVTKELEEEFGVPKIKAPAPFGLKWSDNWLREIASYTGREDIVEDVIKSEHERIKDELNELRESLKGKTVYIFAGDSYAHNLGCLITDLGMKIVGATTFHHDLITDEGANGTNTLKEMFEISGNVDNFSVCNKQPYEVIKLLQKTKPDVLMVRHMTMTILGGKLGIPTLQLEGEANSGIGYDGLITMGKRIKTLLETKGILNTLSEYAEFPYSDWWKNEKNAFFFEKEDR